jgi:hypothetical protein
MGVSSTVAAFVHLALLGCEHPHGQHTINMMWPQQPLTTAHLANLIIGGLYVLQLLLKPLQLLFAAVRQVIIALLYC